MSEENLSHLIARTILRVKYGLATDGEKRTLEQWLEGGEERRRIYDRILSGESWKEYAALREDFDRATDYGQLQSDILQSIRLRNRRRSLRRAIVWGSSVAAVLLVGVLVVARFAHEAKPVVPQQLAQAGRDRCYVCKRAIFTALLAEAVAPLCDGSNASDTLVFRPGSRAIRELGVHTPLTDAGLTKPQIRTAATKLGLADPQQPARPCLLTRFDYGDAPDEKRLQLTQQAEEFLSGLPQLSAGFRVRWLGQRPLLHVSAANALTDKDLSSICEQLTEKIPELRGVQAEVMENLSGWFDRKVDDLSR